MVNIELDDDSRTKKLNWLNGPENQKNPIVMIANN